MGLSNKAMGSKPRRRAKEPEELNLEEMWESPSMKGMLSFLDISPEERLSMLARREMVSIEAGGVDPGASDTTPVEQWGSKLPPADLMGGEAETPLLMGALMTPVELTPAKEEGTRRIPSVVTPAEVIPLEVIQSEVAPAELDLSELDLTPPFQMESKRTVRRAVSVQDAHTKSEQAVYEFLWSNAKRLNEEVRAIAVGDDSAVKQLGIAVNTYRASMRSLLRKLAVEIRPPNRPPLPKTILVFSYGEIQRRRDAAGLTHVLCVTSKRQLIHDPGRVEPS